MKVACTPVYFTIFLPLASRSKITPQKVQTITDLNRILTMGSIEFLHTPLFFKRDGKIITRVKFIGVYAKSVQNASWSKLEYWST